MERPLLTSYEDCAIDFVASLLNKAKEELKIHQTLRELADSTEGLRKKQLLPNPQIKAPTVKNSIKFITDLIKNKWYLNTNLQFHVQYMRCTNDDLSLYNYFEVIFSQPTPRYPIPQATVSVFFRVQEMQAILATDTVTPQMTFRIEGHHTDHDVRFVRLTEDWILATLKMKLDFFRRIEDIDIF